MWFESNCKQTLTSFHVIYILAKLVIKKGRVFLPLVTINSETVGYPFKLPRNNSV